MRTGDPLWPSGYEAWLPSAGSSLLGSHKGEFAWSLYKVVVLWRSVYGPYATERPFGSVHGVNGISSLFRVFILLQYDL